MEVRKFVYWGKSNAFVFIGNKKYSLQKFMKIRFDCGRPPLHLGYRHEKIKQEIIQGS